MSAVSRRKILLPLVALIIGAVAYQLITSNPPQGRKFGQRPPTAVAVEMKALERGDYQVTVDSFGVTQPKVQSRLVSEVGGKVVHISESLRSGAFFKQGDVLLKVDPRDYQVEVSVAEASVAEAEVALEQEKAQAAIAEQDWNRKPSTQKARALALREPQVAAAQAQLKAAKARLEKARLNLERTELRAPYDGRVLAKMVDIGQLINASTAVADIYATDAIEVRLPIQNREQEYIDLPGDYIGAKDNDILPKVIFSAQVGMSHYEWEGAIIRTEGAIDSGTRQLYLIAQIENPYEQSDNQRPSLKIGQFVEAKIYGKLLEQVFILPRRAVSQNNALGVVIEGRLDKRNLTPVWSDDDYIIVRDNLDAGERYSLTPVSNVPAGTRVRGLDEAQKTPGKKGRGERVAKEKEKPAKQVSQRKAAATQG
ncbi:efflux RND transporter periplasmic adaptor subunit [Pleionea sp. CnH1-48]|uniref:efflux RND transporter periplasmic adaptor subunit n=1 Tax=Pleionea sp. CnH1-48 TaxID=2954494 RepID=UPI0020975F4D|nr:efflux RND transporter periplasmic adaptor subunit [Pleionea sp. CnH1-48]MCO7225601.1 efflux RND transporter periplasmic adaptor subunit [Pleionea sp. CnH1-48]